MKLKRLSTFAEDGDLLEGLIVPDVPSEKLVPNIRTRKEERESYGRRKQDLVDIYFNSQPNLKMLMEAKGDKTFEILQQALLDMLKESGFIETSYGQKLELRIQEWERSQDDMKSAGELLKMFNNVMMILSGYTEPGHKRMSELVSTLLKLADKLDKKGLSNEANMIDNLFKEGKISTTATFEEYIKGLAYKEGIPEEEALELVLDEIRKEKENVGPLIMPE